jgi:hypothetical protein
MDRYTFAGTMRAFGNRTPFRPFTIAMVAGGRFEVDHPEALALRDGLARFAAPGSLLAIFDHEGVTERAAANQRSVGPAMDVHALGQSCTNC